MITRARLSGIPHIDAKPGITEERSGPSVDTQPVTGTAAAGFPIVGIGSSTDGLETIEVFFEAIPGDSSIAPATRSGNG